MIELLLLLIAVWAAGPILRDLLMGLGYLLIVLFLLVFDYLPAWFAARRAHRQKPTNL